MVRRRELTDGARARIAPLLPPAAAPQSPAPAASGSDALLQGCATLAGEIAADLLRYAERGTTYEQIRDAVMTFCRAAVIRDGALGLECSKWAWQQFLRLLPSDRGAVSREEANKV